MNEQLLKDFIATAQKYNYDWNTTFGLFPELKSYDQQVLKDYVATAEKYSYDYSKVNSLFPEFGFAAPQEQLKKKGQPQPQPTQQAQQAQGAAQAAQAKPATALPSGASSSALPSADSFSQALSKVGADIIDMDEEDAVPKLNEIFREQGFKFDQTGLGDNIEVTAPNGQKKTFKIDMWTQEGDQQVADELKNWASQNKGDFSAKKAEVSESDFSKSLESITPDLASKDEDFIIPQLQDMFGDYGFQASTSGVGDNVVITAPNKKSITIPVDRWTQKGDIESSGELKKFISENKPVIPKLTEDYSIYESRIRTEEDLKNVKKTFNDEVTSLRREQQNAVIENAWLEKESKALSAIPQSQKGTQEYVNRINEFNQRKDALTKNISTLSEREKDLGNKSAQLDVSIGRYTSIKAQQGNFFEGLWESYLGQQGGATAAITNFMYDIGSAVGGMGGFNYFSDSRRFVELALDKGVDVPQELLISPENWTNETRDKFKKWHSSLNETKRGVIEDKIQDENLKKLKGEMLPVVRNVLKDKLGSETTTEEYLREGGMVKQGLFGLAGSAAAMMAGGPSARVAAFALQGFDATMNEMSSDEFKDVSENEKYMVAVPIAIASGVLEEFGLRNVIGKSGVVNNLVLKAIGKAGANTTAKSFKELVENEVEDAMSRGLLTIGGAALAEAETGAMQAAAEIGIKEIYNAAKGKDLFRTPESAMQFIEEVGEAAIMESIGGFTMGIPTSIATAISENNFNGIKDSDVQLFSMMANDSNFKEAMVIKVKQGITDGTITEEKGRALIEAYDKGAAAVNSMPENLTPAAKRKAMSLLIEKSDLQKQVDGKDEALTKKQRERINEINDELSNLPEAAPAEAAPMEAAPITYEQLSDEAKDMLGGDRFYYQQIIDKAEQEGGLVPFGVKEKLDMLNSDPVSYLEDLISTTDNDLQKQQAEQSLTKIKQEQDAIQKQTAGQVPVQPTARVGEEVEEGAPQAEPQVPAQKGLQDQEIELTQQINELEASLADETQQDITFGETTFPRAEAEAKLEQLTTEREAVQFEASLQEEVSSRTPQAGVSVSNKSQLKTLATKTTDKVKSGVIAAASRAVNTLKSVFPEMDIVIHETTDGFVSAGGNTTSRGNFQVTRDASGKIVKGVVNINLENANMTTVAHEVAHAVMLKAFGDNPALFKRFRDRINTVLADSTIAQLDEFASEYNEADSHEEYLVQLSAVLSATEKQLPIPDSIVQRIAELINKVVSRATNGLIVPFKGKVETKQLIDFLNTMSSSIAKGQGIEIKGGVELNTGGEVGVFNIVSKAQMAAPKATEDSRSFIRDLVQDVDIREFNGMPFVTNMYDYTNAGVTDLGNGFTINMMGGKSYVPYIMSLQNKKIGDVSNLSAFNSKENAEAFIRNAIGGKANLFAPHSGTMSESWQFQQHTFSELVNLILDKNILSNDELINVFNKTIVSNADNIRAFNIFNQKYKEEEISNFDSFKSNPKKIVELLDIQNNFSPDLRKALNNAIAADKTFQKAIGIKNKEQFFERIMDPLNKGVVGGEIISVVKFDPKTLKVVKTDPKNPIDHHPSFGWAVLAKIEGIYQPSEFHKSSSVTKSYTKYNLGGKQVSRKASEPDFEKKNVASSAGAIPKVAKFVAPKPTKTGVTTTTKEQKAGLDDVTRLGRISGGLTYDDAIESIKNALDADEKFMVFGEERDNSIKSIIDNIILLSMKDKRAAQKITNIQGLANAIYDGARGNWNEIKDEYISSNEYEEAMASIRLAKEIKDNPKQFADELKAIAYKLKLPNWVDKQFKGTQPYETTTKEQRAGNTIEFDNYGKKLKINLEEIDIVPRGDINLDDESKWNSFNITHNGINLGVIQVRKKGDDIKIALSSIYGDSAKKVEYKGPLEPIARLIMKALKKIFPKMFKGNVAISGNKGKGIGTKAYGLLAKRLKEEYGKKLISDTTRSDAAEALWRSLERKGLAKVVGDRENAKHTWQYHYEYVVPEGVTTTTKEQVEAYHGSPYDFEKFTTKKMGTGEGAQAFGWGLYFTDIKSIAEEYARKLSSVKAINDILDKIGVRETTFRVKEVMKEYLPNHAKAEWLIEALESNYYDNFKKEELDQLKKFAEYKLKNNNSIPLSKKVYSVSLHEGKTPDQYTWLEWDKELTPNQIKDILEKDIDASIQQALYDYYSEYNDISTVDELIDTIYTENTTGEMFYKILENYVGEYPSDKEASLALLRAGIDGVKYPAESISRGATSATSRGSNYVVFDENAVTIKTKEQKGNEAEAIVKQGRANGVSENAIRSVLSRRGFTAEQIDAAMAKPEAAGKTKVDETFAEGFDRLMKEIEGIIKKSTYRKRSQEDILDNVVNYVIGSKLYENATDVQREQMVRDARKRFGKREKSAPKVETLLGGINSVDKITIAVRELVANQIKSLARGAKDAKKAWMKASAMLSDDIKEMVASGKISSKQAAAVIKRFSKVDMFNETSVENFVNYMAKVFADAEYDEKIAGIKSKLKTAKKNIYTKLGISKNLVPLLDSMLAINPTLVPDSVFDTYVELVDMLSKREAVLSLQEVNAVTEKTKKILDAINKQESVAAQAYQQYLAYDKKVIKDNEVDFAATVKKMVEDNSITEAEAEILRKYKNRLMERDGKKKTEDEIAQERTQMLDSLDNTSVTPDALPSRIERDAAAELIELAKSDAVKGLDNIELNNLLKALDNIANGYFPHQAQLLIERLNAINRSKPLADAEIKAKPLAITKVYASLKSLITRNKTALEEMIRRNPQFFIDQAFGDFKTRDIFKSLFEQIVSTYGQFASNLKRVENRLSDAYNNILKSHKGDQNAALMSSYKITAYMIQNEFDSNKGSKQVNKASDFLKATIKQIYAGESHLSEKNAEMLQEVLDWVNTFTDADGNVDTEAMLQSMSKAERDAIGVVRDINDSLTEKAMFTASVIRGEKIKPLNNYVHLQVMKNNYNPEDNTVNESESMMFSDARKPSSKAKNLVERTGNVSPINFDIFSSAQRGARFVLLDYHMTPAIRTARKTLAETKKRLENEDGIIQDKKTRQVNTAINNVFEEVLKNTLSNTFTVNSFAEEVVDYISKTGYRAVLAGIPRFISELTANMGFALIIDPASFIKGFNLRGVSMSAVGADVMLNLGSGQVTRIYSNDPLTGRLIDTQIMSQSGGKRMGKANRDVANKLQQIYNNTLGKYKNSVEFVADTLIATPDKIVMRSMWFGSFAKEFKKITGVEPDFDKIAANDEAYMNQYKDALKESTSLADEKTVLTASTDNPFMGILKGAPTPNQNGFVKAFNIFNNYMTRFLIYEYMTARMGIMAAMGNGYLTRKQGAAMLGAVLTRMTVYTFLMSTLTQVMVGLFVDEEEEDDEKSLLQKFGQSFTSAVTGLMFGRDFGNATKSIINYGIELGNQEFLDFLREGEYDPYKDAIAFTPIPVEPIKKDGEKGGAPNRKGLYDYLINMTGPFAPALKSADLVVRKAFEEPKKTPEALERQELEKYVRIPLEVLGNIGLVPLYRDVRKVTMKAIYKDLDKASAKSDAEKAQEQLDKPPYGLTMEEYKRYFPKEYEKRYGEKSEYRKRQKEKNKLKDAKDEVRKEMLDDFYNYQPKKKKGFGSEVFGDEGFGDEKFGEDKKTGFGSNKFGEE